MLGEAADGQAALDLLNAGLAVDVALVDARMPGMDGLTLSRQLKADWPQIATLLLTTFDEDELVFGALTAGADGFLLKDVEPDDLVQAIRGVRHRTRVLDDQVAGRVVKRLRTASTSPASALDSMNERELEVARLVAEGLRNRELGARLFIAEGTFKNTVSATLRKLGLRDRTQLALALRR